MANNCIAATSEEPLQPKLSIVVVNYNYGHFLPVTIASCLAQSYTNMEIIVVDDGSTDTSKDIILGFGDQIISVLRHNRGHAAALNAGFAASSGDIVCLLDADDLFLPERAERVAELFASDPKVGWVFTESAPMQSEEITLAKLDTVFAKARVAKKAHETQQVDFRSEIRAGKLPDFAPSTSNLCFSRTVLEALFPLPEIKGFSGIAITDIYIRNVAVSLSAGCVTTENLGVYRFHNNYYKSLDTDKKRRVFGEIYTTTGYWLRKNFPDLAKVSQKFLAKGIATFKSGQHSGLAEKILKNTDADCEQMLRCYVENSGLFEKIKLYVLIRFYQLKLMYRDLV